jgi:hypothetical protein
VLDILSGIFIEGGPVYAGSGFQWQRIPDRQIS